jgi:flagellar biosynthesis/type III secretory pathway protein FliH
LTQDGAGHEAIDVMISDLARVKRQDLLPIAYSIAALVFPASSEESQWLKERFRPLLNLFQDSWAYQEMVAEGKQKGLQEGLQKGEQKGLQKGEQKGEQKTLRETCIRYVQKRFPTLADHAKQQVSSVTDINRLDMAFDALLDATTVDEVEAILVHLTDDIQSMQ